jgi:hypothetical protein
MRIFISYAREDREIAERLFTDLSAAGLEPWLDTQKIRPGERFEKAIRIALRESDFICVLLSARSLSKRGFVQREVKLALQLLEEIPEDEIFLVPVRLDDCVPSNDILQQLHWTDFFNSYEEGLVKLLELFAGTSKGQFDLSFPSEENPKIYRIPGDRHAAFYQLAVTNGGKHVAHGCTVELISVTPADHLQVKVDVFGEPVTLRWAYESGFGSMSLDPGEMLRVNLFLMIENDSYFVFDGDFPWFPQGLARYPPGGYAVKVRVSAIEAPVSIRVFHIDNIDPPSWLRAQVRQLPGK